MSIRNCVCSNIYELNVDFFFFFFFPVIVQNHVQEIKKTHLRDLMSDTDRCQSMMVYVFCTIGDEPKIIA